MQIVWSTRRGARRDIEHIGSAHDDAELEALQAAANQRLAAGQGELDLGVGGLAGAAELSSGTLEIVSSRAACLWDALDAAYRVLGFAAVTDDEVFHELVLARIIEPSSKADSARVLAETGIDTVSYPTLTRRLPSYAKDSFRSALSAACAADAGLGRRRWCFMTCPRCTSKPTLVTGSANRDSPKNAGCSRRSRSAC